MNQVDVVFEKLSKNHLPVIKEIYDYYILNSTATYHTSPISQHDLQAMIPVGHPMYSSYLLKLESHICGYCYLGRYKPREAYDRTAEITIYLRHGFEGKGIGRQALSKLENDAKAQGIAVLLGIISGDNTGSIRLFEKCGYEKCAHFKQVGKKFDQLLDVVAYQKILV